MNKEMLLSLVDKVVKVDRGGPESRVGKLLSAEDDHITLLTEEEGIIYYKTQHIKSITINTKNEVVLDFKVAANFKYLKATDFKGVLGELTYRWVKINRGGPETLEGILFDVNEDFLTIMSNEEIIKLSMYHIRNISYGVEVEKIGKGRRNENAKSNQADGKDKDKANNKQKDGK